MKNPFASVAILAISIIICLTSVFGLAACSTADNSTQQPVTDKYARLRQAYDKVKLQYSSAHYVMKSEMTARILRWIPTRLTLTIIIIQHILK